MQTAFIDTETVGLYGPAVIFQYKFDAEPAVKFCPWTSPVSETMALIERFCEGLVVCHNITFDWLKLQQWYNAAAALSKEHGPDFRPIDDVDSFIHHEYHSRGVYCIKPQAAVCTLMMAQKTMGGASLATKEIRVRKLPVEVAPAVAKLLNDRTELPEIMFARRQATERWSVAVSDEGEAWSDVVLKFAPSSGLKEIAKFVLGVEDTQKLGFDLATPPNPFEVGYVPYVAMHKYDSNYVVTYKKDGKERKSPTWPALLDDHLNYWVPDGTPQDKYAMDDIKLLKMLYEHFDSPETDFDGELGCQVASVRAAGFDIDTSLLSQQTLLSQAEIKNAEVNVDAHLKVKEYINEALDPMERIITEKGCPKDVLKSIIKEMNVEEEEEECCDDGCPRCDGLGVIPVGPMPVAKRAKHILHVRKHKKRLQIYKKLRAAGGAYPSFRVIGTKSGRMAGADKMNYHSIDGSKEIRSIFTMTNDPDMVVSGGDMNSQELAIAAAVMGDDTLADDVSTGKSLHGVFAAAASGIPYKQIMAKREDKGSIEGTWYKKAKICVYAILYGAAAFNISQTLGCTVEEAERTIADFFKKYPHMAETRKKVRSSLAALTSGEGGLKIRKPEMTYIESIFGYRRSFQLEYDVLNILFTAMNEWKEETETQFKGIDFKKKIVRKEAKGEQTYFACVYSALFGGAFSLQNKIQRAALNHVIQSAGRTCTLRVQKRVWDEVQPTGVHVFRIRLMSVHDELATVTNREDAEIVSKAVYDEMKALTETVPLLSLDWATDVKSWYGVKSADENLLRCGWEG